MANNPFETPTSMSSTERMVPRGGPIPAKAPGGLTAICIVCIILGSLGLVGACMGTAGTLMQDQLQSIQQNVGDANQRKLNKAIAEIQKDYFIPNLVLILVNFVVAPSLLAGGIGVLTRKSWGPKFLRVGLLMAAAFVLIRVVVAAIIQSSMIGPMKEAMNKMGGNQAAEGFVMGAFYFGIALSVLWALALVGFYLFSWTYTNRDHVKSYMGTFS